MFLFLFIFFYIFILFNFTFSSSFFLSKKKKKKYHREYSCCFYVLPFSSHVCCQEMYVWWWHGMIKIFSITFRFNQTQTTFISFSFLFFLLLVNFGMNYLGTLFETTQNFFWFYNRCFEPLLCLFVFFLSNISSFFNMRRKYNIKYVCEHNIARIVREVCKLFP